MSDQPVIISGLKQAMRHLSERQKVVAQNIANSETPGYRAREVAAPDFGALVDAGAKARVGRPEVRLSGRMEELGASQPRAASRVMPDRDIVETKPDGNNVTLEEQAMKLAGIQADYTAVTAMYRKQMQLLKIALGTRGG